MCSRRWARPVAPGRSLREPTRYQTWKETTGLRGSSRSSTRRPLSRVASSTSSAPGADAPANTTTRTATRTKRMKAFTNRLYRGSPSPCPTRRPLPLLGALEAERLGKRHDHHRAEPGHHRRPVAASGEGARHVLDPAGEEGTHDRADEADRVQKTEGASQHARRKAIRHERIDRSPRPPEKKARSHDEEGHQARRALGGEHGAQGADGRAGQEDRERDDHLAGDPALVGAIGEPSHGEEAKRGRHALEARVEGRTAQVADAHLREEERAPGREHELEIDRHDPGEPQDPERGGGCDAPERPPGDVRHGRAWRLGDEPPEEERGQERREGEYEEDAPPRHELAQDTGQQQAEGRPEARSRERDALPHR